MSALTRAGEKSGTRSHHHCRMPVNENETAIILDLRGHRWHIMRACVQIRVCGNGNPSIHCISINYGRTYRQRIIITAVHTNGPLRCHTYTQTRVSSRLQACMCVCVFKLEHLLPFRIHCTYKSNLFRIAGPECIRLDCA